MFLKGELEFAKVVVIPIGSLPNIDTRYESITSCLQQAEGGMINYLSLKDGKRLARSSVSGDTFLIQGMLCFSAPLVKHKVENDQRRQPERNRPDDACA